MMRLVVGSALAVIRDDGVLTGNPLLAEYLKYLKKTGRSNLPYIGAAKKFFAVWPNPQAWVEQPLEQRLDLQREARPIITYLMLYQGLRPGYDYLLERKFSSIWREIVGSNFDQQIQQFLDGAQALGFSHHHYLSAISTTQRILFHMGIVDSPPRSGGPVPFSQRLVDVSWGFVKSSLPTLTVKPQRVRSKPCQPLLPDLNTLGFFLPKAIKHCLPSLILTGADILNLS